jgi:hypothetical protein
MSCFDKSCFNKWTIFDLTYADNGENIRRRNGYIYLSPQVAARTNLPNPLKFYSMDQYGELKLNIDEKENDLAYVDIFALYAVCMYIDRDEIDEESWFWYLADQFLTLLHDREFYGDYSYLNNALRGTGIAYFCRNYEYKENTFKITVPKLNNQKEKNLETNEICWAETPLLISRKKLPVDVNTSLKKMAQTWGFVSTYDPKKGRHTAPNDSKQGLHTTRNKYCKYINKS